MIPLQFYNQHLRGHKKSRRKIRKIKKFHYYGHETIKDFGEWLLNYIPPKPKVVDKVLEFFKNNIKNMYEKRDTLFQTTQTKSASKNFTIQYQIKRLNEYDPESFLLNSKQPITTL